MTAALVTGAAGFVGANLARRLVADGHDVHLLVRGGADLWRLDPALRAEMHEADLRDAGAVARVVMAVRPQWVFHCAAYGAYAWQRDVRRMRETNLDGTAGLLAACRDAGVEIFVNTGSSSEYGYKKHPPAETELPEPNSPYALSKLWTTEYCAYHARTHGGVVTTLRLYSAYGPYEEPTRFIPMLVSAALEGALPPLTRPDTARDFVHVDDVCEAYLAVAHRPPREPGAIFNVGTGVQTRLAEVVGLARATFGVGAEPRWGSMPSRTWDTDAWCADSRRLRAETGWTPRHSLANGLASLKTWLDAHPLVRQRYQSAARAALRES